MKISLTLFITISSLCALAQHSDSDFLDMYLDVTEKRQAKYERELMQVDESLFKAKIKFLSGTIKAEGEYLMVDGELIPHGYFKFFYANGQKESEGMYKMGYKVETWKRYMMDGTERSPKFYRSDLGNLLDTIVE